MVLVIIPARAGSKRLPGKNIRPLVGKPLVAWTIEAAREARGIDRLVVSSDSEEVLSIAHRYDPQLPLRRPEALANDTSLAIEYVRHALQELEGRGEGPFSVVVILQPTSPFTLTSDIDATIDVLHATGADSAVTVMEVDHAVHPFKLKELDGDRLVPYLDEERGRMAAHELPRLYVRNCSVYVTRRGSIDRGQIIGDDCRAFVMPRDRSIDINEEIDLQFAQFLLSQRDKESVPTSG
jgi:CMP-N,N'-diacetyllegionaminic acid synthase